MAYISYRKVGSTWLQQHPKVGAGVQIVVTLFCYIVSGQWIVDLVRWLIITAGTVAESAFLLATVYVTVNTVAHVLVTWILPEMTISTLNQMSVIAFSVLPELITFSAIKVTYDHLKMATTTKRIDAYFWFICYSIPTMVFLVMTIITITSFISIEATGTTSPQATGAMLVMRCLAGWGYSMVQMLFASIGKQGYADVFDHLTMQVQLLSDTVVHRDTAITALQGDMAVLRKQMSYKEQELIEARIAWATKKVVQQRSVRPNVESDLGTLESSKTLLESDPSTLESSKILLESDPDTLESGPTLQKVVNAESGMLLQTATQQKSGKLILERSTAFTQEKQRLFKEQLQQCVIQGKKINKKKISRDIGISYKMARKYAKTVVEDIIQEVSSATETPIVPRQ